VPGRRGTACMDPGMGGKDPGRAPRAGHESWVLSVACHPDGSAFATGSSDARVKLWDLQTRTCAQTVTEHTDQARPLRPARQTCPQLWPSRLHVCGQAHAPSRVWRNGPNACQPLRAFICASSRAADAAMRPHTQLLPLSRTARTTPCRHPRPSSEGVGARQLMGARYGERARCRRCAGWPAGPERRARVPQVWGVAWQAGGSYLASASDDKSVAVYDFS